MEKLVAGWTEPIRQQLLKDGATWDATGLTLGLTLTDKDGAAVTTTGKVTWDTPSTAIAKFTPSAGDLLASGSPYSATWSVTNGSQTAYYPNDAPDVWFVHVP